MGAAAESQKQEMLHCIRPEDAVWGNSRDLRNWDSSRRPPPHAGEQKIHMLALFGAVGVCAYQIQSQVPLSQLGAPCAPARSARSTVCSLADERLESAKAGLLSAFSGSVASAPLSLLLSAGTLSAQWEFASDALALQLLLFGVVYRYAVRNDDSMQLKQGAVGAFVVTRVTAMARPAAYCTALPLSCGPPLGYLDWDLIGQLVQMGAVSGLAFGGAALGLEQCFARGLIGRLPSSGLPMEARDRGEDEII